jgi:Ring finger domain
LLNYFKSRNAPFYQLQASKGTLQRFLIFSFPFSLLFSNYSRLFSYRPAENVPPISGQHADNTLDRSPSPEDGTGEPRHLTDEELAWKLMQEEEAEFQRRMMALAGVQYPGISPRGQGGAAVIPAGDDNSNSGGEVHNHNDDEGGVDDSDDDIPDPDMMSYEELTMLGEVAGTVATGLTQNQIDTLPVVKYVEVVGCCAGGVKGERQLAAKEGEEEEQCAVCRIEFEGEDEVKKLPCGHYYHPECVGQWLQQKKICPQCSGEVTFNNGSSGGGSGESERPPLAAVAPAAVPILGAGNE